MKKPRKRLTPEERTEQIIETAAKLFAEKGFDATSIDDIAEACGVAPGLIYHYFDSKSEILRALLERKSLLEDGGNPRPAAKSDCGRDSN